VTTTLATIERDPAAFADPQGIGAEVRACAVCRVEKPVGAFPGPNSATCDKCARQGSEIRRRKRAEELLLKVSFDKLVAAARGDNVNAPRISQIGAELIGLFGGVKGYCLTLKEQIDRAIEKNAGSRTVLDALNKVAILVKASSDSMDGAADLSELSDEDLQAHLKAAIGAYVDENKEALLIACQVDDELPLDGEEVDDAGSR